MNDTKRIYNPNLASILEELLNEPYNKDEGPECSTCKQNDADEYELTGYVIDDGSGVYVEKECKECKTIIHDGNGDFYSFFRFSIDGEIIEI